MRPAGNKAKRAKKRPSFTKKKMRKVHSPEHVIPQAPPNRLDPRRHPTETFFRQEWLPPFAWENLARA